MSKIGIIIEREYLERVKKKSFIFTTLLMPLLMVGLMTLPAIIMAYAGTSETSVLVVDNSGGIAGHLEDDNDVRFSIAAPGVSVDSALRVEDTDMVLIIPENIVSSPKSTLKVFSNGPSSVSVEATIRSQVNDIVEEQRLAQYNIGNLAEIIEAVKSDVAINTIRQDKGGEETLSTDASFGIGIGMSFVLYMFLILYGQMVMNSIIEEKNNRVLEVVVTSVKPTNIMLGKITGVALVALTQILIWGVLVLAMSAYVLPAIMPQSAAIEGMASQESTMMAAMQSLTDVGQIASLVGLMTLYLMLGFLVYAAIFAAVGSSVDNVQDATQLTSFALYPIIFGLIFAMVAAANPSGSLAFWSSLFPLTSPMVMVARVPFGIAWWEILASVLLLVATFFGLAWMAGKIYRVGIFMYGKKPSVKEVIKWISYK
ncbi:MAG: ABC transporter permease [Duncaniella sp.]|nr:ABC transporter permease [Duncaniella sp.]